MTSLSRTQWRKHKPQTCLSHVVRWTLAFLAFTTPVKSAVRFCFSHSCWHVRNTRRPSRQKSATFPYDVIWHPDVLRMSCICILNSGRNGENNRLAAGATPPPPCTPCSLFTLRANPPSLSPSSTCHAGYGADISASELEKWLFHFFGKSLNE